MSQSILVVAGEISGDMHAARLIKSMRKRSPQDIDIWGIGGPRMRDEGVETLVDISDMAVMGLWEVLKRYRFFKKTFDALVAEAEARKPDLVLLVDYPGFNLRFAKEMKQRGINVVFYVCPQVWAWKSSRIPKMAEVIDRLLVIFPFEVAIFNEYPLQVDCVEHPLLEEIDHALAADSIELPWQPGKAKLALLPGSRDQEIERILPVMLETAKRLPDASPVLAAANHAIAEKLRSQTSIPVVEGSTREILRQADAALVVSGTATLETGLIGCPMAIVYKTSPITYAIGKRLVKVPHIGMVNVVAQKEVCPEFIQHEAEPQALAKALTPLLKRGSPERTKMIKELKDVSQHLRDAGATDPAVFVLDELATS